MAKLHFFILLVLFGVFKVASSCYTDNDCAFDWHCCEDNTCYSADTNCPIVDRIAGGVVAAIIISVLVFVGIIVAIIACCCCACCPGYRGSPGHVIVAQPGAPYQQFGTNVVVQSSTTQTAGVQQPPPQYPQGPPAYPQQGYPQQGYPQQGYPPNYSQQPPKY